MVQFMQHSHKLITILIISLLIMFVYACGSTTDSDEPDSIVIEGVRELVIVVTDRQYNPLSGFDIEIDGPTSASESGVSDESFVLTDLKSGKYTINVSLVGYVSATITADIELSDEISETYLGTEVVSLSPLSPPVTVDNSDDVTVFTAPSQEPGYGNVETEISIPAGSFPDDLLDEDGNIEIRATRSSPNQITPEGTGTVQDFFDFEPDGVELNNEIELVIIIDSYEGIPYVLQPGDIPLELDEAVSKLLANARTESRALRKFRARISSLQSYMVVPELTLLRSKDRSSPVLLGRSGCGQGFSEVFEYETGTITGLISRFTTIPPNQVVTRLVSYDGKPETVLRVSAQIVTLLYELVDNEGNILESESINSKSVRFFVTEEECHDSGGG